MSARSCFVLLLALAACGHSRTVGPAAPKEEAVGATGVGSGTAAPSERTRSRPGGNIEIASSPAAILKPGAARVLQEQLRRTGDLDGEPTDALDGPMRAALARFQRAHALPATGLPDDKTMAKLGLKPGDVFRSGTER
jgi:peptidoglycan hydrolase-like protein with peptidoglycan-binding domain